jgi:hypothetical protein
MPAELQVIRASEFVCLDPNEHMDFEASKNELQKLAKACRKRGLHRALLDLRGLPILPRPHFNTKEVASLVGAFRDGGFTQKQRLAVLYEHDVYGIIRNFTLFSREQGLQVEAFLEYEKAMNWLYGRLEDTAEWRRASHVPITKPKTKKNPAKPARAKTSRKTGQKIKLPRTPRLTSHRH